MENTAVRVVESNTLFNARDTHTNPPWLPNALLSVPTCASTKYERSSFSFSCFVPRSVSRWPADSKPPGDALSFKNISTAPPPVEPHTSVACASSTRSITSPSRPPTSRFKHASARNGAQSPSTLNKASVTISLRFAFERSSFVRKSPTSLCS